MVKYLHDDALQEVTASLTDCPVSSRLLNARLEAYSMKRAGTDKKYATALQARQVTQEESLQEDLALLQNSSSANNNKHPWKRQRSVSTGDETPLHQQEEPNKNKSAKQEANSRPRSNSLDAWPVLARNKISSVVPRSSSAPNSNNNMFMLDTNSTTAAPPVPRRLLTDLILTLNQAFPDYDFAAATEQDFVRLPLETAVSRINERLSEVAYSLQTKDNRTGTGTTGGSLLARLWGAVDAVIDLQQQSQQQQSGGGGQQLQIYQYIGDLNHSGDDDDEQEVLWSFHYLLVNKHMKRILLFTCTETMVQQYVPAIPDDDVIDDESRRGGTTTPTTSPPDHHSSSSKRTMMSRRESVQSSADRSETTTEYNYDNDFDGRSESGAALMETMNEEKGDNDNEDDDEDGDDSIDFDLDPSYAVSGGIPIDSV